MYCISYLGTENSIIEPTGSIVDPDTVANVMPLRGKANVTVRDQSFLSGFNNSLRS